MEQCQICKELLSSKAKLNIHLVFQHEAFDSGDIRQESIRSLEKLKDQVKFILLKFPEARSNDKILYLKVMQYFSHNVIYDSNDKLIKPASGKPGFSYLEWIFMPSYETCRRSRQYWQEKARSNIKAGLGTREDNELLPSEKVAVQREIKEQAFRQYFITSK